VIPKAAGGAGRASWRFLRAQPPPEELARRAAEVEAAVAAGQRRAALERARRERLRDQEPWLAELGRWAYRRPPEEDGDE
jgi:hypothetical protein